MAVELHHALGHYPTIEQAIGMTINQAGGRWVSIRPARAPSHASQKRAPLLTLVPPTLAATCVHLPHRGHILA